MSEIRRTLLEQRNCTLNWCLVARGIGAVNFGWQSRSFKDFITALPPRFGRHQVVRAVVDDQLAEVFGAVLDGSDPDIGVMDDVLPSFPPKWGRFVQTGIALLFDHSGPVKDGLLNEFHDVRSCLVSVPGRIVFILAKVGTKVRSGNSADEIVID